MLVTSSTPLKVYLFDGGVVIFGSVLKQRSAVDLPADDEVSYAVLKCMSRCTCMSIAYEMCMSCFCAEVHVMARQTFVLLMFESLLFCSWDTCCKLTTQPCCLVHCSRLCTHDVQLHGLPRVPKRRHRPQIYIVNPAPKHLAVRQPLAACIHVLLWCTALVTQGAALDCLCPAWALLAKKVIKRSWKNSQNDSDSCRNTL